MRNIICCYCYKIGNKLSYNWDDNMIDIMYVEINDVIEKKVTEHFGSWIREYQCIQRGIGCFAVAALHEDKVEALNMWYSLNYCMCHSAMLGQSIAPGLENQQIIGYYYAKILSCSVG